MEQINKALRNFELILTEFAGIEKIMTEDRRLQFLKICKDAQRQANGAKKSYGNCNIPLVSAMLPDLDIDKAEELAWETEYACFAVEEDGNEINKADAGAFFLEGYNYAKGNLR